MSLDIKIDKELNPGWLEIRPKRVGPVPSTLPTPNAFVLVSKDGKPTTRIDVFYPVETYNFRIEAICWKEWIAVGCCNLVHLVPLNSGDSLSIPISELNDFGDYFSGFWCEHGFMLVMAGCGLVRIEPNGCVRWRNHRLGLDGIELKSVSEISIKGSGEWDPPGGWKPFQVSTTTGFEMSQ